MRLDEAERRRRYEAIQRLGIRGAARELGVKRTALQQLRDRIERDAARGLAQAGATVEAPSAARVRAAEERAAAAEKAQRAAEDEAERYRERLELQGAVPPAAPGKMRISRRAPTPKGHTPVIQVSDVHRGARVLPEWVDGLGRYDEATSRRRMETLTASVVEMIHDHRRYRVDELVVILGGDLVHGELRADDSRSNDLSPTEQVASIRDDLVRMLRTWKTEFGPLRCIVTDDNHGRIDEKIQSKGAPARNLSVMAARLTAETLNQEGVTEPWQWTITSGGRVRFPIYKWHALALHGHDAGVKFAGSTSGIAHTLARAGFNLTAAQASEGRPVDHVYMHHWHSPEHLTQARVTANGSVVGVDPYARSKGLRYSEPMQMMTTWHPVRGLVEAVQIHLEAPGWAP